MDELDLTHEAIPDLAREAISGGVRMSTSGPDLAEELTPSIETRPYDVPPTIIRENVRGDLARGLLYLLTFAIGGVLVFIGSGRLDGTVLTQSVFPSLIALAGTALGFYFGSQTNNGGVAANGKATPSGSNVPGSRPDPTG
jgi:hypothetical protein